MILKALTGGEIGDDVDDNHEYADNALGFNPNIREYCTPIFAALNGTSLAASKEAAPGGILDQSNSQRADPDSLSVEAPVFPALGFHHRSRQNPLNEKVTFLFSHRVV